MEKSIGVDNWIIFNFVFLFFLYVLIVFLLSLLIWQKNNQFL